LIHLFGYPNDMAGKIAPNSPPLSIKKNTSKWEEAKKN
jgi:hypothetical protein